MGNRDKHKYKQICNKNIIKACWKATLKVRLLVDISSRLDDSAVAREKQIARLPPHFWRSVTRWFHSLKGSGKKLEERKKYTAQEKQGAANHDCDILDGPLYAVSIAENSLVKLACDRFIMSGSISTETLMTVSHCIVNRVVSMPETLRW